MSTSKNSSAEPRIAGVLLAAGTSRRLGRPKQLVRMEETPLLARVLEAIASCCDHGVICVLGAYASDLQAVLDPDRARIVVNPDWREGIGASIRCGVEHVPRDARAILLAVCDQPLVSHADYCRLIAAWSDDPRAVVAAGYGESFGVPAIFPAAYRERLRSLRGDTGAKALISESQHTRVVDMPNAAFDVDDAADVERLARLEHGSSTSNPK